jgi:hypothetical protein
MVEDSMNRAVKKLHQRRCALKANNYIGGGLNVSPADVFTSSNGVPIAENLGYNDCYDPTRPGQLQPEANPDLAQAAMAGGRRRRSSSRRMSRRIGGGCGCGMWKRHRGGQCGLMKGGQCGLMKGGQCGLMKGGQCTVNNKGWLGGRRRRTMRGGNRGFMIDPSNNIGNDGPIAEPLRIGIPCDARAGTPNPFAPNVSMNPDPRAPAWAYSLTPNTVPATFGAAGQTGGGDAGLSERIPNFEYSSTMMGGGASYGSGNAYDASCYRAPGSEMPVYPATTAGFTFTPSTEGGATLPDGVTAFNEVVAVAARTGGGRRKRRATTRRRRVAAKKSRKHRRNSY